MEVPVNLVSCVIVSFIELETGIGEIRMNVELVEENLGICLQLNTINCPGQFVLNIVHDMEPRLFLVVFRVTYKFEIYDLEPISLGTC